MKEFIATVIIFPLLMWFTCQYTVQEVNHTKIVAYISIVNKYAEEARQEGCFTADNIANMKNELSRAFGINASDVTFEGDTTPIYHYDGYSNVQMIHYKVSVPIKKFLADSSFWGISDNSNVVNYSFKDEVVSELLPS